MAKMACENEKQKSLPFNAFVNRDSERWYDINRWYTIFIDEAVCVGDAHVFVGIWQSSVSQKYWDTSCITYDIWQVLRACVCMFERFSMEKCVQTVRTERLFIPISKSKSNNIAKRYSIWLFSVCVQCSCKRPDCRMFASNLISEPLPTKCLRSAT